MYSRMCGSNPAWRAKEQDGSSNRGETEHQLKKYREVEFFGLLPPKPIYMGRRRSWRVAADCKSVPLQVSGFESHPPHQRFWQFPQLIDNCSVDAYKRQVFAGC